MDDTGSEHRRSSRAAQDSLTPTTSIPTSRAELIRRMRFVPQVSPFRVGVRYNNMGTILAGEILERISGKSWSEFVRERLLKPLEMTATVPDVLELAGVENVATPYVDVDGRLLVDSPLQEDRTWALPLTASAGVPGGDPAGRGDLLVGERPGEVRDLPVG